VKRFPSPLKLGGIVLLFSIGIIFRGFALPTVSGDMHWFLLPWYDFLKAHGVQGLGISFSNYTPPYLYLLWLGTLTSRYVPEVVTIKLISTLADAINAILVYRIVRLKYPSGLKPWLASAIFWVLPTVMINSSLWGQADALYTLFLLACFYYLLTDRPRLGMCAFGIALAFKAQAIFLFPLLMVLFFKKQIAWQYFLLIPVIYILLSVPAILIGRNWLDVLTVYFSQASTYHDLSRNAPNLYIFLDSAPYALGTLLGLIIATLAIGCWVWSNARTKLELGQTAIVLASLVSVALVPFVLPKMHDRYFYPADVFSLLAAFYMPELWFVPVLYQIISTLAYLVFLFNAPPQLTQIAAVINTIAIGFLVWKQIKTLKLSDLGNASLNI
jgi:Gpi18-like mannosyltransferase